MRTQWAYIALAATVLCGIHSLSQAAPGDTTLVSVRLANQTTSFDDSNTAVISGDGRFVAFSSASADLVTGDTNHRFDVFVRNVATGAVERVSVDSAGVQGNSDSYDPTISADGRYVAFTSQATNLVDDGRDVFLSDVYLHDRQTGATERVTHSQYFLIGQSEDPSISADGRYIAFESRDSSLVPDDTNDAADIFVLDRMAGTTERVSVSSAGAQASGLSREPSISADGQRVAFFSYAADLVAGDQNEAADILVRDRMSGSTVLISVSTSGDPGDGNSFAPRISADGLHVAFNSNATTLVAGDTNGAADVFVRDLQAGATQRVNIDAGGAQANGNSGTCDISADGRFVTFESTASNLVAGDRGTFYKIFVWDRTSGAVERVDVSTTGQQPNESDLTPSISDDGRYVAYESRASNLAPGDYNDSEDIFLRDRQAGATNLISAAVVPSSAAGLSGSESNQMMSGDGRFVVFAAGGANVVTGDDNRTSDVFVRDTQSGSIERISSAPDGNAANGTSSWPAISSNGRFVAFVSNATDLVAAANDQGSHLYVRDRQTGAIELIDVDSAGQPGDNISAHPTLSADGRYVAFISQSMNLVPGDTTGFYELFIRDRQTGTTERASVDSNGNPGNSNSDSPVISADGRFVAFSSRSSNLVANDTNDKVDTFVHDRVSGATELVSVSSSGVQADDESGYPSISANGRYVAFQSYATNLVSGADTFYRNIFVRDRVNGTTISVSVDPNGEPPNDFSDAASISEDGRFVAFDSYATNLVAGVADTNESIDVFVRDLITGKTELASVSSSGAQANASSYFPSLNADGRFVGFTSDASNLATDPNGSPDVYVHERTAGTIAVTLVAISGVDFGNQPVNTTGTHTFNLTNTGTSQASIISITMTGGASSMFVPSSSCGSSLAPGATCMITVSFTPTSKGLKKATLKVEVAGTNVRNRPLSGTGVAAAPTYTLTPTSIAFGQQRRNTSSAQRTITLRNTGGVPVAIQSIGTNGGNAQLFTVTHTCGTRVDAGATCAIRVVFRPTSNGAKSTTLRVLGSGNTPTHTAPLTGTGIN